MVAVAFVALAAAVAYGAFRWAGGTRQLRSRLEAARLPVAPAVVDLREFEAVPAPVQRYFRRVLKDGQPMVTGVRVRHQGTFNMGETKDRWRKSSIRITSSRCTAPERRSTKWRRRSCLAACRSVRPGRGSSSAPDLRQ